MKVLVAEDDASLRKFYRLILSGHGHEVALAASGGEAIELLGHIRVDLVITDRTMPGISGEEVTRFVKQRFPETKVLMAFSEGRGVPAGGGASVACVAGADGFLAKPFSPEDLEAAIAGLMADKPSVLVVDDDPSVREVFAEILAASGCQVWQAASAREALILLGRLKIRLLVTDYHMPDMNGAELIRRAKEVDGNLKVIICTGEGGAAELQAAQDAGADRSFRKPVGLAEFQGAARELIGT